MELLEASHSLIPRLGWREGHRHGVAGRGSRRNPRFLTIQAPTWKDLLVSQINTHNCLLRPRAVPLQRGMVAGLSLQFCTVSWSIEADVADGHLLYVTGDIVALGRWDPYMAILLSRSKENSRMWKAEVKIPSGVNFKYNYFIREHMCTTSDILWRPGPVFSLSVPLILKRGESIIVRDLWVISARETPPFCLWSTFLDVIDKTENPPASSCGKYKRVTSLVKDESEDEKLAVADSGRIAGKHESVLSKDELAAEKSPVDQSGIAYVETMDLQGTSADLGQYVCDRNQPVEEPWLFTFDFLYVTDASNVTSVSDKGEMADLTLLKKRLGEKGHAEEVDLVRSEDSMSTVILVNSSVCTIQRTAILENGNLVELLLEPVKNNAQCGSVYLGVVTRLASQMGAAFVNIGISRSSLMQIKPYIEPFTYPPFCQVTNGHKSNALVTSEVNGHPSDCNREGDFYADDRILDQGLNDSTHFGHGKLIEHDVENAVDDSDIYHRNVAIGYAKCGGMDADSEFCYEDDEDASKTEAIEESCSLEMQGPNGTNHLDTSSLQHTVANGVHYDESRWSHVCPGTKIIVQVHKEGLRGKGPLLTAYPKLSSRFWILEAQGNKIGVSKKICGTERTRLREIARKLQPPGFGLTVRTVAMGHSLEELHKDLEGLLSTWKDIIEHAKSAALAADDGLQDAVPTILHRARGQTLSVVQDYFNEQVKVMVVDSPRTYHEVTSYLQEIAPDLSDRVILYDKRTPIFDEYGIEEQINNLLRKRVLLSNGGSLVIEETEALVSIDVNGGSGVLGEGTSQGKAILDINLAACKQIAHELRLRDIGGLIVVDFISMIYKAHKKLVYEVMKKAVEKDRSMVKVSELSNEGLMELTRKRVRPSVSFLISEPCPCCDATGRVEALETIYSKIEHEICRMLARSDWKREACNTKSWPRFALNVDHHMFKYLTSGKRSKLVILSSSLKVWIHLKVARGFRRGVFDVQLLNASTPVDSPTAHLASIGVKTYGPSNPKLTLFPVRKTPAPKN